VTNASLFLLVCTRQTTVVQEAGQNVKDQDRNCQRFYC